MKFLPIVLLVVAIVAVMLYRRRSQADEDFYGLDDGLAGSPVTSEPPVEEAATL